MQTIPLCVWPARLLGAVLAVLLGATALITPARADTHQSDDWYPSRYGAADTLGAINNLSAAKVKQAASLVKNGKTYSLGVETGPTSPAYPGEC
ncbi:MAG: hypothetical protein AAF993_11935, partial [Pseudomonadota bacterium]